MPIASIDSYPANHWADVLLILQEAIEGEGFEANLVSYAEESGIIQQRIVSNLYQNELVICDVSAKNPNVMFELGMRLAFDKPTIVVKDDQTDYSFDTSPIEHLSYPRDLHFHKILAFKEDLKAKINGTYEKSKDPNYSTFLQSFGTFKPQRLDEKPLDIEAVFNYLDEIKQDINRLKAPSTRINVSSRIESHNQRLLSTMLENALIERNWTVDTILNHSPTMGELMNTLRKDPPFSTMHINDFHQMLLTAVRNIPKG